MAFLRGHLLIAAPRLVDPNFRRTVVLIILHDEQGAFGVVLNRPADSTLAELWEALGEPPCDRQQPVFVGGPVAGPVLALHSRAEDSEREVVPGVHFSAHKEQLDRIVRQTETPFLILTGYSGWGAGQLERELQDGGWMTLPATAADVFGDPEQLWAQAIQRVGRQITDPLLGRVPPPHDPSAN
jgi:putative transcriptional regulator